MALILPRPAHARVAVPRPRLPRRSAPAAAAVFAGVFLLLAIDLLVQGRAPFDLWLLRDLQRIDLPHLDQVLRPVDRLTDGEGAVVMWVAMLAAFVAARWWVPAMALATLPMAGAINEVVGRYIVERPRPAADQVTRVVGTDAPSFPSGHVLGAVLLYGFLFVAADRIQNRALRLTIKAAAAMIIPMIGFARMWYGAHWPSDILGAYALGGLFLVALVAAYRRVDAAVGHLPLIRSLVPAHDESLAHAHALTSVVVFDGDSVQKIYGPGLLPRALYWASFQAEFPYIRNTAALRAAMYRRNLAGMLTEYWYGSNRVARVTGVEPAAGQYALVSDRVHGHAPGDRAKAKAFLTDLRGRFEQAGLPTWQIDPRQPRAVDNLIETPDGTYHVVDLESGLVSPLASVTVWKRAIRRGQAPLFDEVFYDVARAYVMREEGAMRAALGDAWFAELAATLDAAEAETESWRRSEPRLWGRLLRGLWSGFGVRTWRARAQARLAGSQDKAREWIGRAVDTWEREQRVTATEAAQMRAHMNGAEFQAMLPHLGAHIIISIPLRFPLGSIARAGWSLGALTAATARLLLRRIDRRAWKQAWSIHSPLVIVLSAVPGFGTFAYLAAKPVRSNRLLLRATFDVALKKAPWRLYQRTGLPRLIARPAGHTSRPALPARGSAPAAGSWLMPAPGLTAALAELTRPDMPDAPAPSGRPTPLHGDEAGLVAEPAAA